MIAAGRLDTGDNSGLASQLPSMSGCPTPYRRLFWLPPLPVTLNSVTAAPTVLELGILCRTGHVATVVQSLRVGKPRPLEFRQSATSSHQRIPSLQRFLPLYMTLHSVYSSLSVPDLGILWSIGPAMSAAKA